MRSSVSSSWNDLGVWCFERHWSWSCISVHLHHPQLITGKDSSCNETPLFCCQTVSPPALHNKVLQVMYFTFFHWLVTRLLTWYVMNVLTLLLNYWFTVNIRSLPSVDYACRVESWRPWRAAALVARHARHVWTPRSVFALARLFVSLDYPWAEWETARKSTKVYLS